MQPVEKKYKVLVENIFEGPMDLLVFLIRKNEVNIYDIPIALITDQYLGYLEWMKEHSIDFAGDFLVLAATLTQIKSKLLLPVHPGDDEDMEDPRLEITRPLLEYLRMKSVAEELQNRNILGDDIFVRNPPKEEFDDDGEEPVVRIGLFELIDAFKNILDNMPSEHKVNLADERFTIKDKINHILEVLETKGDIHFHELFTPTSPRIEMVVTFLAILEIAKLNLIQITQEIQTGVIRLAYI